MKATQWKHTPRPNVSTTKALLDDLHLVRARAYPLACATRLRRNGLRGTWRDVGFSSHLHCHPRCRRVDEGRLVRGSGYENGVGMLLDNIYLTKAEKCLYKRELLDWECEEGWKVRTFHGCGAGVDTCDES